VEVEVLDFLAGVRPRVGESAIARLVYVQLLRHLGDELEEVMSLATLPLVDLAEGGYVLSGNDQNMHRSHGVKIMEGDETAVL